MKRITTDWPVLMALVCMGVIAVALHREGNGIAAEYATACKAAGGVAVHDGKQWVCLPTKP